MSKSNLRRKAAMLAVLGSLLIGSEALASTLTQNLSWTIDRSGTTTKRRLVAYGDSIYAGYYGSLSYVSVFAGPTVQGDYLQTLWKNDIETIRRTKSGAIASAVYNEKIVSERSYMQATNTRVVTFEMCGNDGLQARTAFKDQSGTCNYGVLNTALSNCTTYQAAAMSYINANAYSGTKLKVIGNLHYPGYNADNVLSNCTDSSTGAKVNMRNVFLPYIAKMNWRACNYANTYGFKCADSFANYMAADYDRNGNGQVDSDQLKYVQGESEAAYVTRITSTLKPIIIDSNTKYVSSTTSYDYIQSDDTHPTYAGGTAWVGLIGGSGSGSSAPDYADTSYVGGKNPIWNRYGHERWGWALSVFNPATP